MSFFSLASAFEDQVHALAIIESGEDPLAVGDGGRAFGLLQQHPAFFRQWYGSSLAFLQSVTHTWEQAQIIAAASFFERYIDIIGADGMVSAYNTGIKAYNDGQRNQVYLAKWGNAYQDIRCGNHHCKLDLNKGAINAKISDVT